MQEGETHAVGRRLCASLAVTTALCSSLLLAPGASAESSRATPVSSPRTSPDPGSAAAGLIVEYAPGAPVREAPGVPTGADSVSATDLGMGRAIGDGLRTVEFSEIQSAEVALAAAEQLERDPAVLFAEPDWIIELGTVSPRVPISPRTVQSSPPWGLDRIDQRSGTNGQYRYGTTGQGVDVYVVDSGIRSTHVDLAGRVTAGANFYPGVTGTSDCTGHGTHVAGTIGGTSYGVAKSATLIPVRVFGCDSSTLISTVVSGLNWVLSDHTGTRPAVVNMSLGGGPSTSLDSAVANLVAEDITVVVASGNDNDDACEYSPARAPEAITVNASMSSDDSAPFSNYGSCTDIYAPGVDILSAWNTSNTAAVYADGTSMASPHVAGTAARVLEARPQWGPEQVLSYLQSSATSIDFVTPLAATPDALLYMDAQALVGPDMPTGLQVTADYEALDVSWTAPAEGPTPGYYRIEYSQDGATWLADDTTSSTSATVDGLDPAISYSVRVRSVLGDDSSAWLTTAAATQPLAPTFPGAVPAVNVLPQDDTTVSISWSAPDDTGGRPVLYYALTHSTDDSTWVSDDTTSATSWQITGLAPGVPVRVRVRAVNVIGAGPEAASATRVAPRTITLPAAPGPLTVTAGNTALGLSWSAPVDDGGRPIASYAVQYSSDDSTWVALAPVAGTSTTITGLANGQPYSVRVAATTSFGTGPWTTGTGTPVAPPPSSGGVGGGGGGAAPPPPPPPPAITAPGAPTITGVTAGDRILSATWLPSDDTGGEAPTSFAIELEGDGTTLSREVAATEATFDDLVNGLPYRIRVAAINSGGTGPWSQWSAEATPRGLASAPLGLTARAADAAATIAWLPPESDGGAPVSGYVVEVSAHGATQRLEVTDTSTVLAGLINGRTYAVRVAAMTAAGQGAWSVAASVTPRAVRVSAPRDVTATRTARRATVTWTAPAVGTPLRYVVTASIDGRPHRVVDTTRDTRSSFPLTARARTVVVRIAAVDAIGRGPFSQPVSLRTGR